MPIHPELSLGVQLPKINTPLESLTGAVQLRDLMAQQQLRRQQILQSQAQTADLQAQAQDRQQGLADQQTFNDLVKANSGNVPKAIQDGAGKIRATYLMGLQTKWDESIKNRALTATDQINADLAARKSIGASLTGILLLPEDQRPVAYLNRLNELRGDQNLSKYVANAPEQWDQKWAEGAQWQGQAANVLDEHALKAQELSTSKAAEAHNVSQNLKANLEIAGQTAPDGSNQGAWDAWRSKLDQSVLPYVATEASADNAAAVRRGAVAVKEQPEFGIKSAEYESLKKKTPAEWDAEVDAAISPTEHPEVNTATKALRAAAIKSGSYTAAQAALKDGVDQIGRTLTAVASAKATAPIKIENTVATERAKTSANMTEDDWKREGQQYALSGTMPPMGRGSAERSKITHYKDEFARENGLSPREMLVLQASYQGDRASLAKLQSTRDMVVTAESTANKNLDQFLSTAGSVIDSKSPWINRPLREINRDLLGNADQVAYDTARNVAVVEIGKVLNQVSGSGSGVLSDSARKEVSDLIGPNATLAQIVKATNILKTDMKNRHDSMDAIIGNVKDRIGGLPSATPAPASPANRKPLSEIFTK